MRKVYSRIVAILALIAITSQAAAAPTRDSEGLLFSIKTYAKRFVTRAFDMLGTPPG